MTGLPSGIYSSIRRRFRPIRECVVEGPEHLAELAHWADKGRLRLEVPVGMLRMQGAFVYGPDHPFVQALTGGRETLIAFYSRVSPRTIAEYYGLEPRGRTGAELPPWELPWYLRALRTPPPGERGLDAAEGVSFYGPASSRKINLEMERMANLREKIRRHGYAPDVYGDIEGYVVRADAEAAFFVRGGKHRAAVLAAAGRATIPVAFREGFPRMIDASQSDVWPLVRSGAIDRSLAEEVLRTYTQGRTA